MNDRNQDEELKAKLSETELAKQQAELEKKKKLSMRQAMQNRLLKKVQNL